MIIHPFRMIIFIQLGIVKLIYIYPTILVSVEKKTKIFKRIYFFNGGTGDK